jgi:lipopolysaccharide/colanic/teichoic acid biosynthesis glycosyltransferase
LAKVADPDSFYEEVLEPLKVRLAMEHVVRDSFWFDMKILLQTVWMLTLGRFRPIELHPEILKLKRN